MYGEFYLKTIDEDVYEDFEKKTYLKTSDGCSYFSTCIIQAYLYMKSEPILELWMCLRHLKFYQPYDQNRTDLCCSTRPRNR
jgi:hypothetical protein